MEVDEKPTEDYNDIGGLEKQVSIEYCLNILNPVFLVLDNAISGHSINWSSSTDSRISRSHCFAHDPQGAVSKVRSSSSQGSAVIWTSRDWENINGPCLCSTDKCHFSEIGRSSTGPGMTIYIY